MLESPIANYEVQLQAAWDKLEGAEAAGSAVEPASSWRDKSSGDKRNTDGEPRKKKPRQSLGPLFDELVPVGKTGWVEYASRLIILVQRDVPRARAFADELSEEYNMAKRIEMTCKLPCGCKPTGSRLSFHYPPNLQIGSSPYDIWRMRP